MPEWKPEPIWKGQDAFIIGGGTSLRRFNWDLLIGERTIGCNQAFRLGEEICDIAIFGDFKFIVDPRDKQPRVCNYEPMSRFKNPVVTNDAKARVRKEPWILWMPREHHGLHKHALGWNGNTGAAAINLALILGAVNVYLLGFDMHLDGDGKPNWHKEPLIDKPKQELYSRMITAFAHVCKDLRDKFPGCQIVNVTDDSNLNMFPKVSVEDFWRRRSGHGRIWTE